MCLSLGTLENTSALSLEATLHITWQNHQQEAKNAKHMALNRMQKGHLFTVRAKTRKQSAALFDLSWEVAHRVTHSFHHSGIHE